MFGQQRFANQSSNQYTSQNRIGSTYIIVVGAAMLITIFVITGLTVIRIQRSQFQNAFDSQQARLNAEAALDLGLNYIRENPSDWRDQSFNLQSEYGAPDSLQLQMTDPVDGDLFDSAEDPVVLVATGSAGDSTQFIRARLNLDAQGFDVLQSAIHAGNRISLLDSNVEINGTTSYDQMMTLVSASSLKSVVLGMTRPTIDTSSSVFGEITSPGDLPKDLPTRESIDVVSLYAANAVQINVSDLYVSDHRLNRLSNSDLQMGIKDWDAFDCEIVPNLESLLVSKRLSADAGARQDVKNLLYNGGEFRLACKFKNNGDKEVLARIRLQLETAVEGVKYFSTRDVACPAKTEIQIVDSVTPTWNSNLLSAYWIVSTASGPPVDFEISQPGMFEETYPDGAFAFRNVVLAPQFNPFGSGQPQAEGLYVLDADNKRVFIENSKVEATMILKNSSGVTIRESVHFQNSVYNYPTIIAQNDLKIGVRDRALLESNSNVNFNPIAVPYRANSDTDTNDSYESRIDGLVYVNGDLSINGDLKSKGVWITDNNLTITGSSVEINYAGLYYDEPPPGFVGLQDMRILPGSFRQVVGN